MPKVPELGSYDNAGLQPAKRQMSFTRQFYYAQPLTSLLNSTVAGHQFTFIPHPLVPSLFVGLLVA